MIIYYIIMFYNYLINYKCHMNESNINHVIPTLESVTLLV